MSNNEDTANNKNTLIKRPVSKNRVVKKKVSKSKVPVSSTKTKQPNQRKVIDQNVRGNKIELDSKKIRLQKTLISAAKEAYKESKI